MNDDDLKNLEEIAKATPQEFTAEILTEDGQPLSTGTARFVPGLSGFAFSRIESEDKGIVPKDGAILLMKALQFGALPQKVRLERHADHLHLYLL